MEGTVSQLLIIIIAVLGTVVGMALIAMIIWLCVLWNRKRKRRKWCWHLQPHQSYNQDAYGFPPHREMIELGCIRSSDNCVGHHHESTIFNNNTGVSKGLGLGASYRVDQLPALPAPRSWTPSPPYDSQQMNIQNKSGAIPRVVEVSSLSKSRKREPHATEGKKSKSWLRSELPSFKKSFAAKLLPKDSNPCHQHHSSGFVDVDLESASSNNEQNYEGVDLSLCSKNVQFHKSSIVPTHQTPEQHLQKSKSSTKSESSAKKMLIKQFQDQPMACSSSCGSPNLMQQRPLPTDDSVHHHHTSNHRVHCNSSLHHSVPSYGNAERDFSCRRKHGNLETSRRNVCVLPEIIETSPMHDSTLESVGRSPIKFAEHHDSRCQSNHRLYPTSPNMLPHSSVFSPTTVRCNLLKRDMSKKYDFCQSCGRHPDIRTAGSSKRTTRSTQTYWTRRHFSKPRAQKSFDITADPTPSLSWDNLTPAPSPILTLGDTVEEYINVGTERRENLNCPEENGAMGINYVVCEDEEGAVGGW
ncbi:hypothetical protein SK128_013852 [Halocaridina rubra]|uniref:Uncharacterized protein n=1 Tax=Halocaridina rubra TaxID=373956 RepID=A0AAN8XGM9_HALRR